MCSIDFFPLSLLSIFFFLFLFLSKELCHADFFMLLITIISLCLAVASAKGAENTCVSLAKSKTCSAFSQFYIGLPGLAYDYPFLINTTTIEEFDERLLEYVNSTSDYLFPLGCLSSNYNPTIPYARYSLTRLCVGMIQNPGYSLPCNFDNGLTPPPLCQSTCFEWVESITHITQNPRVCSDSTQRNTSIASFTDQCDTWEGYNGTITENCISGIANEPYSCGNYLLIVLYNTHPLITTLITQDLVMILMQLVLIADIIAMMNAVSK